MRNVVATIQVPSHSFVIDDDMAYEYIIPFLQLFSMNLAEKAQELKLEQKKTDALLFQMLPMSVAMKLKEKGRVSGVRLFIIRPESIPTYLNKFRLTRSSSTP